MRFIKLLSSVVFSLLIILAIGAYLAVRHFDLNQYKSYAEDMVQREIGRKLKINGDAAVAISLVPTIVINDVELANAEWAAEPQMIRVKQIEVKFALLPLLKKQIVIDRILLGQPEIYLQKKADGTANWDFGPAQPASRPAAAVAGGQPVSAEDLKQNPQLALLAGFAARDVLIENGTVQYIDGKNTQNAEIKRLAVEIPGADEKIALDFDVVYNGNPISGRGTLGAINTLMQKDAAYPVMLDVSAYKADIALNGSIVDLLGENPLYAFESNIYNPSGNLGAPETTLKARIDGDVNGLKADIGVLNVAANLITGGVEAKWNGKLPWVKANLKSDRFNLQSLNAKSSPLAFELPSVIGEARAISLPNEKVPYAVLKGINADVTLNVKKLIVNPAMQADNVYAAAKLNNGVLNVNPLRLVFGGGELSGRLTVNANQQTLDFALNSKNMKLQNLHSEFAVSGGKDFGVLSGGDTDIYITANSSGATYPQLLGDLNGSVVGIVGKSELQTGALEFLKGNILTQLLNILKIDANKTSRLDLTCAVVRADIAGGKAVFPRGIAFDSKQITIVSDGQVNLQNDKLNFTIEPSMNKLMSGNVTQALASFIKVSGTLDNPKVGLDDKAAVKTLIGMAATGGVSYLGSQVFLNGDGSPCYTALEGTAYASRFPKPSGVKATTQNVVDGTQKQLKQGLKDLKNTAKDILKSFQIK